MADIGHGYNYRDGEYDKSGALVVPPNKGDLSSLSPLVLNDRLTRRDHVHPSYCLKNSCRSPMSYSDIEITQQS